MMGSALHTNFHPSSESKGTYYRLVALWVLCEAMLGGIIHGLKIPVSGLVVGSCAIVCICLIAWYVPQKGAILKATVIVAIFKMMLSPQAPPPAYVAVFFQGLLGELLFWKRRMFTLSCILLAVLGLLESGLQRILMLTIVYGNDFWKVVNNFFNGLTKQKEATNYSLLIGGGYVLLHLLTGIVLGTWAGRLPRRINAWRESKQYAIMVNSDTSLPLPEKTRKKKKLRTGTFIIWILLIALYVQSYYKIGTPLLPSHISMKILLRSLIIILGWIFIVGPLLTQALHWWLKQRQSRSQKDVQEVLALLPSTQQLVAECWKRSAGNKGWKRIHVFNKMVLVNALTPLSVLWREVRPGTTGGQSAPPHADIFILTAPVQSGKTTSLVQWSSTRSDVHGILTPVINGKRVFMDAQSREQFHMEATEDDEDILAVGRFVFSKDNFGKAVQIIRDAIHEEGWLVIDEVGPLELRGEGFSEVLHEVLSIRQERILLVVRDKDDMVSKVKSYIGDKKVAVLPAIEKLPVV